MCGIVGLLIKKREQRASLGRLAQPMFTCMGERGPDSGGLAVFGPPLPTPQRRFSLFVPGRHADWQTLLGSFRNAFANRAGEARIVSLENHAVLVTAADPAEVRAWLAECIPA